MRRLEVQCHEATPLDRIDGSLPRLATCPPTATGLAVLLESDTSATLLTAMVVEGGSPPGERCLRADAN